MVSKFVQAARAKRKQIREERRRAILEDYGAGEDKLIIISFHYSICPQSISRMAHKAGVKMRRPRHNRP